MEYAVRCEQKAAALPPHSKALRAGVAILNAELLEAKGLV
jgi:hypothetical protein